MAHHIIIIEGGELTPTHWQVILGKIFFGTCMEINFFIYACMQLMQANYISDKTEVAILHYMYTM